MTSEVKAYPVCKICGKMVEDANVLSHVGREHADLFLAFPNPLADLVFKAEKR